MTETLTINSPRLVLVAATVDLAKAERDGGERFATLLGAGVPADWPPPLNDEHSMNWMIELLDSDTNSVGWALWYFLRPDGQGGPEAIGNGGFKGKPSSDGMIEVGYSIMEKHQRAGYATEAVNALIDWAFARSEVNRVIAHTLPDLTPSIRVIEKCGFGLVGDGPEPGVILFERKKCG